MEAWVGPAIIAAAISSLVSALGWFVGYRLSLASDDRRRQEKIRDFQIALKAEIHSELSNLQRPDLDAVLADVEQRYAQEKDYSVIVPRLARHLVFDAIAKEIHILPEGVIEPVVLYVRQRQAIESFVDDMRDTSFKALSPERQLAMYRDYLGMWRLWTSLAEQAKTALEKGKS